MALALLSFEDSGEPGGRSFRFEIGRNRFYRFAVGNEERRQRHGIELLAEPVWVSELGGPLPERSLGRGRFSIPEEVFTREARFVQMMSYRTDNLDGPAVSRIVESARPLPNGHDPLGWGDLRADKAAAASRLGPNREHPFGALSAGSGRVLSRPMDYRVRRVSHAMFLDNLLALLPGLLQPVSALLRNIGPAFAPNDASTVGRAVTSPETLRQLTELIAAIANSQASARGDGHVQAPTAPAPPSPARAQGMSLSARWRHAQTRGFGMSSPGPYATAQALPLLALAPMLMPLLQQVLNPQTVQALLDAPSRSAQTVINGLLDAARIGIQADQAQLDHLRQLNPGVDDPGLDQLLMNMSLSLSGRRPGLDFKRVERVRLAFEGLTGLSLNGQTRVLFAAGRPLRFPVSVELPRLKSGAPPTLHPAVVQLQIKNHDTLDVVIEKRFSVPPVTASGSLPVVPEISIDEAARLQRDKTYLVSVALVWKSARGEKRGTLITSRLDLIGGAVFDRVDDTGPVIDLSDPVRFREYWHRVWTGRLSRDAKRYAVEVSYLVAPAPVGRVENARLDTETRFAPKEGSLHTVGGRLKSGMELSSTALNQLLSALAPERRPLEAEELSALDHPEFRERLSLGARHPISLRGQEGEAVAIWAFPAMRLATVMLATVEAINGNGHVTKLGEKAVTVPIPALLHLVGTCAR